MRKRDYDISELIQICSKPSSIEERVKILKEYGEIYPELKLFLIVAYYYKDSFSQITKIGDVSYTPSKMNKGGSGETLTTMWEEVTRLYDSFPSGPRIKRSKLHRLLIELHPDDAELVYDLVFGKFYSKELNEVVVSQAFPDLVPEELKN